MMLPSKCSVTMELLGSGRIVSVVFDARHPDIVIPRRFRKDPRLAIEIGYYLPRPIHDLYVDPTRGVGGTLSFPEDPPMRCHVPWAAVWTVIDNAGNGVVWEEEMPATVRGGYPEREEERRTQPGFKRRGGVLRLVPPPPDDGEDPGPRAA